jgi:O-acetyl-ADP-ribose deacetylase (regulator of RNase III)
MRKINMEFAGKRIGMPKIGAGLAGGNWNRIEHIINTELKDCKVTVVNYKPE